uniref:Uncharacterized protein n=1 Tax=Kalanchoe fedtschenkoi TaxID=63787 RepID=A0A7N0T0D5_KALFE
MASRRRHSSPFHHQLKPPSPLHSSCSSNSSLANGRVMARTCGSASSIYNSGGGTGTRNRSVTSSRGGRGESVSGQAAAAGLSLGEAVDAARMADSISVTIRFRPLSEREFLRGDEVAWYADGDKIVRNEFNPATAFGFDKVFGPSTVTQEVYDVAAKPVVKAAMDGVNGTVFAYGVTSSGKTHTMHGDQNSPGIIPMAINDVFSMIQDTPGREFLLRVSYLEIYNEIINDLLDPTGQNLRVREDAQGTYVEGIKEEVVLSPGHALSFIASGEEHRHVGSNNFNLLSSRSHTIFTLMIESSAHGDEYDGVIFSQLNLIDLAGSESSKTETTGLRRKEGSYINKSLLTLGTVIGKLSEGKASHIPYRDSKLTRLLQSSLSGHGYVSLICTITPASSNMEETHNTLKFASRAKRVEINASRNKLIDEKSLIKKYQKEISTLKHELEQLRKGMIVGINPEELLTLKQQFEEGQVKMQSRLEEEEDAKAALVSRIQRLTKLILVSSKNALPLSLNEAATQQSIEDEGSLILGEGKSEDSLFTTPGGPSVISHPTSSSKGNDELSPSSSSITESTQVVEVSNTSRMQTVEMTTSDQLDLFVEQAKMLAGEIALGKSTLKRLLEQSVDCSDSVKAQIQNVEREIDAKKVQMQVLEHHINKSGEASVANASDSDMHQTVIKLMTQCSERSFELEIKSADNRILQEQLQNKISENEALQERVNILQQQQVSVDELNECIEELKKKVRFQEFEKEKLKIELVNLVEGNTLLRVQNQKVAEEASYAKQLASAAAVELKNLANEVSKLSHENAKLKNELLTSKDLVHKSSYVQNVNGFSHKHIDPRAGRKSRISSGGSELLGNLSGDFELDPEALRIELQARIQKEAVLEAELVGKKTVEDEYRKNLEQANGRVQSLENDLANTRVLVAELKKQGRGHSDANGSDRIENATDLNIDDTGLLARILEDKQKEDYLVDLLKTQMQEMKDKQSTTLGNTNANSHLCKLCSESAAATVLLPCRHLCLCKSCSVVRTDCPICHANIVDRLFIFPS